MAASYATKQEKIKANLSQYTIESFTPVAHPVTRVCCGCDRWIKVDAVLSGDPRNFGLCRSCSKELALADLQSMTKVDDNLKVSDLCECCAIVRGNHMGIAHASKLISIGGKQYKICNECLSYLSEKLYNHAL